MEITLDGICGIKLYQNKNGYRFSVDAVLLYAFINVKHAKNIIDLGTGSGIIGLLLAKKYTNSRIILVELQESLYRLVLKNITINGLDDSAEAVMADIKDIKKKLQPASCDIVVSNPPFRKLAAGLINPREEKAIARHEIELKFADLAESAAYLLRDRGRFFIILHPERILEVVDTLRQRHLEPKRVRFVYNNIASESKMVLIEAVKDGRPGIKIEKPLIIYDQNGFYTEEVKSIYEE